MSDTREIRNPFSLVAYRNFEDLLGDVDGRVAEQDGLVSMLFARGRSLIQAPSGRARTRVLEDIAGLAAASNRTDVVRFSVPDLKHGDSGDYEDLVFRMIDIAASSFYERTLFAFDGLDEVSLAYGAVVLRAVEVATSQNPQIAVVATDGLGRRPLRSDRWALFAVEIDSSDSSAHRPVSDASEAARVKVDVDGWRRLFTRDLREADEVSLQVGRGAMAWLRDAEATVASREDADRWMGEPIVRGLVDAGLIVQHGQVVRFVSYTTHAYFVALAIAESATDRDGDLWSDASIGGANLLAIEILLEGSAPDEVANVLRSVDAWNYQASGRLLANSAVRSRTPEELAAALVLLLGHRRFSRNPSTSVIAADLLRLHRGDTLSSDALHATSRQQLLSIAAGANFKGHWWADWCDAFAGSSASTKISFLDNDDQILAWTAANALAVFDLDASSEEAILRFTEPSSSDVARWRATHALQGSRSMRTARVLLDAFLHDPEEWVRYGALRSTLQIASRLESADDRFVLCAEVAQVGSQIYASQRWVREIERAARVKNPPSDWPEAFGTIIEAMWSLSGSVQEEDRWRAISASLRTDWNPNPPGNFRPIPDDDKER